MTVQARRRIYVPTRPPRKRWPWVKRDKLDVAHDAIQDLTVALRAREQALANLGHKVEQEKRECAHLVDALRIVRIELDLVHRAGRPGKVAFMVEMSEALFDGYRRDRRFVDLVSLMVEERFHREPEGRALLAGFYTG